MGMKNNMVGWFEIPVKDMKRATDQLVRWSMHLIFISLLRMAYWFTSLPIPET